MSVYLKAKKSPFKPTKSADWIFGSPKSDKINGLAGDDYLYGLDGNDKLSGSAGDDFLTGQAGNDYLRGGDDDDYLSGNDGNDKLYGDDGDDSFDGGIGNDKLYGSDGNDDLNGGEGSDNLKGDDGNDHLSGGEDIVKDVLSGGKGKDYISIRQADLALGGAGVDILYFNSGFNSGPSIVYNFDLSKITGKKAANIGYLDMKAGQFEKAELYLYDAADGTLVTGSKGNDRIYVSGSSGTISGGAGSDIISVSADISDDQGKGFTVNGGAGEDSLRSRGGNNTMIGGAGNDVFTLDLSYGITQILDFTSKDRLLVSKNQSTYFEAVDRANLLVVGSDPQATSTKGQFLYDTDDGRLLYDYDGTSKVEDPIEIFIFTNKAALTASSFVFDF